MNRFYSLLLLAMLSPLLLSAQEWRALGPWGGSARIIVEDTSTGTVYLAGYKTLYCLERGEEEWQERSTPSMVNEQISQIHAADGILFVMMGVPYRSSDGGASWQPVTIHTASRAGYSSVVMLRDTLYVAASTSSGHTLYRSTDSARTWDAVGPITELATSAIRLSSDGNELVIIASDGLYRRGGGTIWSRFKATSKVLAFFVVGNTLILIEEEGGQQLIYRSFDRGREWRNSESISQYSAVGTRGDTLWAIRGGDVVSSPISTMGGRLAWTRKGAAGNAIQPPVTLLWTMRGLLRADLTGAYRWDSVDARFIPFDTGRSELGIIHIAEIGDTLVVGTPYRFYVSGDGGEQWIGRLGPNGYGAITMVHAGDRIYATFRRDSVYRSDDRGLSWRAYGWEKEISPVYPDFLHVAGSTGDTLLAGGNGVAIRSVDGGTTWRSITLPNQGGFYLAGGSGDTVVVRTTDPQMPVIRSVDAGATWTPILFTGDAPVITGLGYVNGVLYLSVHRIGVMRSIDLGAEWLATSFPAIDMAATSFGDVERAGDTLFVPALTIIDSTAQWHLFASIDNGEKWMSIAPPAPGFLKSFHRYGESVMIGTDHYGLYSSTLTLDVPDHAIVNPSNSRGIVTLDATGRILSWRTDFRTPYRLDLYTLTGEHVALIAEGEAAGGSQLLPLDDLPAGTYLCVLHSGGESAAVVVTAR